MKKLVLFSLIALLLSHTMSQFLVVSNFLYNQDYIAENLCENKDEPVLQCNGQCQLAKELENNEEKQPNKILPQIEISVFIASESHFEYPEICFIQTLEKPVLYYGDKLTSGHENNVFHPPCC